MQVIAPRDELGVVSFAWQETVPPPNSAVFRGFVALELARVDGSIATCAHVQNRLAAGSIALCGSAGAAGGLPKPASSELMGSFGLADPCSGSDASRMRESVVYRREAMGSNGTILDEDVARLLADAEAINSYDSAREMDTHIVGRAVTGPGAFV